MKTLIGADFHVQWSDINQPILRLAVRKGEDSEQTIILAIDEVSALQLRTAIAAYVKYMSTAMERLK